MSITRLSRFVMVSSTNSRTDIQKIQLRRHSLKCSGMIKENLIWGRNSQLLKRSSSLYTNFTCQTGFTKPSAVRTYCSCNKEVLQDDNGKSSRQVRCILPGMSSQDLAGSEIPLSRQRML